MSRSRVDHAKAVEELHGALTARLGEMTSSDDWLTYLSHARKFHRYSPQNQLLLALQGAEGAVAGYRSWQRIPARGGGTCQVRKGEHGLQILAPLKGRRTAIDEVSGEEVTKQFLRGFRTVKVFHQGQLVVPPDIGEDAIMPMLLTGESRWQHVWSTVTDQLTEAGFDVALHSRSPMERWNGQTTYATRDVLIADDLEPAQQLKTLLHEWAHVTLDHENRPELARDAREVEAESVAFLLGQTVGLDTEVYSVPYIAGWAGGDLDLVASTAQQVLTTTKHLVDTLQRDLGVRLVNDPLDHALPEADTNVVELPTAADARSTAPEQQTTADRPAMIETDIAHEAKASSGRDGPDAEFLRALGHEFEPDQAAAFVEVIYRPEHAGRAAEILAESGRTALQTARIMERFGIGHDRIRKALEHDVVATVDNQPGPLYPPAEVDRAISTIDPTATARGQDVSTDFLRGEKTQDMRMLQRVLRTTNDARLVVELADALDVEPANVIRVCEASNVQPSVALAVAVGVHRGDGAAALDTLKKVWPDIEGGWDSHAHPSMLSSTPPAGPTLVPGPPEHDPILEMFAEWNDMGTIPADLAPQPLSP